MRWWFIFLTFFFFFFLKKKAKKLFLIFVKFFWGNASKYVCLLLRKNLTKKLGGAVLVHMAVGSNVKHLCHWVVASIKKICLCQNFWITISSNYSKNLGRMSSKIFSKLIVIRLFSWHLLEITITQLFLKLFPKYRKNFLEIACSKIFLTLPLSFLRIYKHMPISSEFWNSYKFTQIFESLFPQIIPNVRKNLTHIFTELSVPRFAWSLL